MSNFRHCTPARLSEFDMIDDSRRHHRRSIRLRGYDYTRPGAYFVTICAEKHACQFGEIMDGEMQLNTLGKIVREEWFKSAATKRINARRGTPGAPVWQRNYYEHIIRDEESLNHIRQYIHDNPLRWAHGRNNLEAALPEAEESIGEPSSRSGPRLRKRRK